MAWEYEDVEVIRVIDGDSAVLRVTKTLDFGFRVLQTISYRENFRLYGINTPEIRGVSASELKRGVDAKNELARLLGLGAIRITTYKPDKYGRWLADIYVRTEAGDEIHVNQTLVDGGHAVPYNG